MSSDVLAAIRPGPSENCCIVARVALTIPLKEFPVALRIAELLPKLEKGIERRFRKLWRPKRKTATRVRNFWSLFCK
jgi:hypothetical protein